jgi:hypothetical protein
VIVRLLAAPLVLATGCTAIFGLTTPERRDGGAVADDADVDAGPGSDATDGGIDGPLDGMPDALVCSAEFVTYGTLTSKYFFGSMNKGWALAETDCETRGGHLVVIGDETERMAIHNVLGGTFWIGISDLVTDGTFVWVTDESTGGYPPATGTPWASDPKTTAGDCVQMTGAGGTWSNNDCGNSRNYLCECDGYAANPANY